MKKNLLKLATVFAVCVSTNMVAQTPGTLTFTFTQNVPSGTTANKNVYAVWIENSTGTFIKTKARYVAGGTNDHLPTWMSKSSGGVATTATAASCSVVDASTGATRTASSAPTAFGAKTITWNGTNAAGTIVPDGVYKVWIESAYCNPQPSNGQHWLITSYSFTKGPNADHQTPAGNTNFTAITLDWNSTVGIEALSENSEINVYPNPSSGIVNVDFKKATEIKVENILGELIYDEKVEQMNAGTKTIDLTNFPNGNYFISVMDGETASKYKVILNK